MRAGKHCVSFQTNCRPRSYEVHCGIMRPTTKDITSLDSCYPADDLSMFSLKEYEILHGDDNVDCLLGTYNGKGVVRRRWRKCKKSELITMNIGQYLQAQRPSRSEILHWEGLEPIQVASFKVGMVLDLDEGTLDVYKNDNRLGTMRSGLVGEYCWAVSFGVGATSAAEISVTIGR